MRALDLTGQRFGKLEVVEKHHKKAKHGSYRWICICYCGKEIIATSGNLRSGHTKSCGCLRKPHGYFGTRLYNVWSGIKKRCLNPNNIGFKHYGERGITVCDEWLEFEPFRDWALENGYKEKLQIDRINVDGNYKPNNCRFVSVTVNNQNRRVTILSPRKVILIRYLLENTNAMQKTIGKIFNVPQNTISQIKHGKLWGSISKTDWNRE